MSAPSCSRAREVAPDVALGVADGEDRADVFVHLESCPSCRAFVRDLSQMVDGLALLAPAAEPPSGFDHRVQAALRASMRASRRPTEGRGRWSRPVRVAAAFAATAAAASILSIAVVRIVDSRTVPHGSETVSTAGPGWVPMLGEGGQTAGRVLATTAEQPSIVVAVDYAVPSGSYDVVAATADRALLLGALVVVDGRGSWVGGSAVDPADLVAVRLVAADGTVLCEARFDSPAGATGAGTSWGSAEPAS